MKNSRIAVLSDFDCTISTINVLSYLYECFDSSNWRTIVARWDRGEISTPQEIESCFASIHATREEMEKSLDAVELDPAFKHLVQFCRSREYYIAVASDGLRWYIEYILNRHKIHDVAVFANEIHFTGNGYRFSYPWSDPSTPLRGTSKPAIIRRLQAEGKKVIFIGDGLSDVEAAEVADVVYASDILLEYTIKRDVSSKPFVKLIEVVNDMGRMFKN